jgi:hypothetical protein
MPGHGGLHYNSRVPPRFHPGNARPAPQRRQKRPLLGARRIYGLVLIALLILLFTILRFWERMPWSAR